MENLSRGDTDTYTKEQLHEAFSIEVQHRKVQEKIMNQKEHEIAKLRAQVKRLDNLIASMDSYIDVILEAHLRLHIEKFVGIVEGPGEPDASLDYFFNHPKHHTLYTEHGGYICYVEEPDCLFVEFMWHNKKYKRAELNDHKKHLFELYEQAKVINKPIRYTGTTNVLRNHSEELEPGLWQVRLDDYFDDQILKYKTNKGCKPD